MSLKGLRTAVFCLCLFSACAATLAAQAAQTTVSAVSASAEATQALASTVLGWKAVLSFDALGGTGRIIRGPDLIRFKVGYDGFVLGSSELLHSAPIHYSSGKLVIPGSTARAMESWLGGREAERQSKFAVAMIIIDPGHGGKDPGAIGEHGATKNRIRVVEKEVALSIAQDVYRQLSERWPDKKILITRSGDTYPSLEDRVTMAHENDLTMNEAVIFVSIHANASFNKAAEGYEVWYLNPTYRRTVVNGKRAEGVDKDILPVINSMLEEEYTTESIFLATKILDGLTAAIGNVSTNRGLRPEEWFVVRNARMPSVLIETGFVTNEAEARLLADPGHLRKLGEGIYNGIVNFVDYFEHRRGPVSP